ncbi:MAG: LPXTG cell wall anchor domain-containing protein [Acidimicrobiales bacterium]
MELAVDTTEVDPAAEAIESYVEGSTDTGSEAGFPWVAAAGLLLAMVAAVVVLVLLRRKA